MKYQNFYERYYFKLLVVLSATFIVCNAVFSCCNGTNQCLLSQWSQWTNCTSYCTCGVGTSLRFKQVCSNSSYTRIKKCAADFNVLTTDYFKNITCGQTCLNGVFRQNSLQCPNSLTGKYCESEKATIPVATNRSAASSSKNGITICSAVFTCTNGQKQCGVSSWLQWSNCTSSCGGGISRRFKSLCCDYTYTSIRKCATDCNITTKDYVEMKVCGQTCVNGVFRQNKCQCPQRFTGKCCESEIAIIPVATNGFTASSSKTEITNNVCEQGCKFGECKNGTCSCMAFFKGKACQKPEPWFLVVTSVLGTILMTIIACCVCCFCFGYGKKVEPEETETRVK